MFSNYSEDVEEIDISGQRLTILLDLSRFKNLKTFNCRNNQLSYLPPLPSTLQRLDCYNHSFSLPLKTIEQWKFYSGFSQLKTIHQNDLAKKIQRKWRTYWDEPYKIQPWEDGTTSPICRCQENYFKEFTENFL